MRRTCPYALHGIEALIACRMAPRTDTARFGSGSVPRMGTGTLAQFHNVKRRMLRATRTGVLRATLSCLARDEVCAVRACHPFSRRGPKQIGTRTLETDEREEHELRGARQTQARAQGGRSTSAQRR